MKKLLLLFLFFIITLSGFSQVKPKDEIKKSYIKDGKVYWNKSLPITIKLCSPDNIEVELDRPFYLDTEGVNYIRTKWEMDSTGKYVEPLHEQLWKVYADSKPPTTKIKFISSSSYAYKGKTYYSDDLKIKLISNDELSGVAKIYYSVNESEFQLFDTIISLKVESNIKLNFYSVDNVGNIEELKGSDYNYDDNKFKFGIDDKAPKTKLLAKDSILSPKDVLNLVSSDSNGVGVYSIFYALDSSEFEKYVGNISLTQLSNGSHKLKYYSLDNINNKENVNEFIFYLDTIPPEVNIKEDLIKKNIRKVSLTAHDNLPDLVKIYYKLNENTFIEYKTPFNVNILNEILKIRAIDRVGNENIRIIDYRKLNFR